MASMNSSVNNWPQNSSAQAAQGTDWYHQLSSLAVQYAKEANYQLKNKGALLQMYVWAGNDIETNTSPGDSWLPPSDARAWVDAINTLDRQAADLTKVSAGNPYNYIKVIDNGAIVDGCSTAGCWNSAGPPWEHGQWTAADDYYVEFGSTPNWPGPEIYYPGNSQWYSNLNGAAKSTGLSEPSYVVVLHGCGLPTVSGTAPFATAAQSWQDFVDTTSHHPGSLTDFHALSNAPSMTTC